MTPFRSSATASRHAFHAALVVSPVAALFFALVVALVGALSALPAAASTVTISGDTTGAPTFQRPVEDLSALSAIGTATPYNAYAFTAGTSGLYSFNTVGSFDTFVLMYDNAFLPAAALTGALIANDDLGASLSPSGFDFGLLAGRQYVYVVTGFDNTEFGSFTTTIVIPTPSAVPEPASWALVALGLVLAARRRGVRA